MTLIENPNLDSLDWVQILNLYSAVNWTGRKKATLKSAFQKSSFVCIIIKNEKVIGMGRTFDDGAYYGTVCDLIIHPKYQGLGYGTKILDNLKSKMKKFEFITLTAAPGKSGFYNKKGWTNQKSAFIWPKNEKQKQEHGY